MTAFAPQDPIPAEDRIAALEKRRVQLERHLERCRAALEHDGPNPSIGREIDDARATLATVHAELARLADG